MSSLARKIQKKLARASGKGGGPGMGQGGTVKARVILKENPKTGEMQEYHLTKGWR